MNQKFKLLFKIIDVDNTYIEKFFYFSLIYFFSYIFFFSSRFIYNFDFNYFSFYSISIFFIVLQINQIIITKNYDMKLIRIVTSFLLSFMIMSLQFIPLLMELRIFNSNLKLQCISSGIENSKERKVSGFRYSRGSIYFKNEKFTKGIDIDSETIKEIEKEGKENFNLEVCYFEKNSIIFIKSYNIKRIHTIKIECNLPCDTLN